MARLLIVDDEEKIRKLLSMILSRKGYDVTEAENGRDGLEKLSGQNFDLVISDIKMPEMDGKALILKMKEEGMNVPLIFITAFATVDSAVEMMRQGAVDYITKPFDHTKIEFAVQRALKISRLMAENQEMKQELEKSHQKREFIYKSQPMKEVVDLAANVAEVDTAVLICGESGTGKEVLARYIHDQSQRAGNRFVPVNCAAITANLVESELFGYEKGAFTGANARTRGKFEFASKGTLFLDEIGDLPLESQAKLLRALQEKRFQRVGGNQEIYVDVRVICATNRNLEAMVAQGRFRQDLFYRINIFPIVIPPLRQRSEDIIPLARHLIGNIPHGKNHEISDGACQKLKEYPWPGNVRELANVIERGVILTRKTALITADTLSFLKSGRQPQPAEKSVVKLPPGGIQLQQVQKSLVVQALRAAGNNQTSAAKLLGVSRAKFRVLMKKTEDN